MYRNKKWIVYPSGDDGRNVIYPACDADLRRIRDDRRKRRGTESSRVQKRMLPQELHLNFLKLYDWPELYDVRPKRITYSVLKKAIREQKGMLPLSNLKVYNLFAEKNHLYPRLDKFYESRR